MRRFVDLHLRPSAKNLEQLKRMIIKSSELGYHLVGITLPQKITQDEIHQLQKISSDEGIELATRVDLTPKTRLDLLNDLRRLRQKFEVLSVTCTSKPVARQAAKDRRVDLLSFPTTSPRHRFFDNAEAQLASRALASLEIDMAPILLSKGFSRIRLLSCLRNEVAIAEKFGVPITISSGATNTYLLRGPYECAALATLFDMTQSFALRALSEAPMTIVERNKKKLSPDYVAPGIRIVKRGNC